MRKGQYTAVLPDKCEPPACDGKNFGRGLCRKHYRVLQKRGLLTPRACWNCGNKVVTGFGKYCSEDCGTRSKNAAQRLRRKNYQQKYPEKHSAKIRRLHLKKHFGISVEQYESMLASQGRVCAICKDTCHSGMRLSVDHDHRTNSIRGLLCGKCNIGLGHFRDDVELLSRAITYLTQARG